MDSGGFIPTGIGQLPDELLLEVLEYLKPVRGFCASDSDEDARVQENRRRIGTLHALSLLDRKFHAITQPVLYQAFIQPQIGHFHRLRFLFTIIAKPDLAVHLQYLEGCDIPPSPIQSSYEDQPPPFPQDRFQALDWIAWDHLDAKYTYRQFKRMHVLWDNLPSHNEVPFLVALCPSLCDLALTDVDHLTMVHLALIARKKHNREHALQRLWYRESPKSLSFDFLANTVFPRHVTASEMIWIQGANLIETSAYPYLPLSSSTFFTYPLPPTLRPTQQVKKLVLEKCEIGPGYLDQAIGTCAGLKEFTCRWGVPQSLQEASPDINPQEIDLARLNVALSHHADTLTHVTLDTLDSGWRIPMDQDVPPFGSFREYKALTHLSVAGLVLWGDFDTDDAEEPVIDHPTEPLAHILPPGLEELVIWSEWDEVEEQLTLLPRDAPKLLPKLKMVDCSWRPALEFANELIEEYADIGIELRLFGNP